MRTSDHVATKTSLHLQRGATLMLLLVGVFLAVATFFAIKLIEPASRRSKEVERTQSSFSSIEQAIVAFVAVNGRLPCPANGLLETGLADPNAAAANCNNAEGSVPWATLGLAEGAAFDGWNRKISYRVFSGATGLTQGEGASMVQCDTKMPYGAEQMLPSRLCSATPPRNLDAQFLAGKGFAVNNLGVALSGIAYVLVSHGESGVGAWPSGGAARTLPVPGNERSNTSGAGPFTKVSHSDKGVDPMSAAHFDDLLAWKSIQDLARQAGRQARDWPDPTPPNFSPITTTNMNSAGSGRFNATTASGGQTISAIDSGTTLDFGAGGLDFANCAWWPSSFRLYNGVDRFSLRTYVEFATSTDLTAFGGFTVGFLSKSETDAYSLASGIPFTGLCGKASDNAELLGWGNGSGPLAGNLPNPRFAVEVDAFQHGAVSDPAPNHFSVDFNDVSHTGGSSASICSAVPDSYHNNGTHNDCYTAPGSDWLRSGLSEFHRMRIEITPRDPVCSGGLAPKLRAWIMPRSLCLDASPDPLCSSLKNIDLEFVTPTSIPSGMVVIESCVPAPTPSAAFNELYFGFTAARRNNGTTSSVLYLRNLNAGAYFIP